MPAGDPGEGGFDEGAGDAFGGDHAVAAGEDRADGGHEEHREALGGAGLVALAADERGADEGEGGEAAGVEVAFEFTFGAEVETFGAGGGAGR